MQCTDAHTKKRRQELWYKGQSVMNTLLVLYVDSELCSFCQKLIEGVIVEGNNTLVIEDVVTSGASVLETCADLRGVGLSVTHAVVLLDREQGGRENIQRGGVVLHSVITLSQLMQYLLDARKVSMETVDMVLKFVSDNGQLKVIKRPNPAVSVYTLQ